MSHINFAASSKFALLGLAGIFLSACTTVDVTNLGAVPQKESVESSHDKGNVITRTVHRMTSVFTNHGWCEDQSRSRVQSAANVLLDGLQNDNKVTTISSVSSSAELVEQVNLARHHVRQTTKAAEVFLDVAASDAPLKTELKQLQLALKVSEEAIIRFDENAQTLGSADTEITALKSETDNLRLVTDRYGDAVRTRRLASNSNAIN